MGIGCVVLFEFINESYVGKTFFAGQIDPIAIFSQADLHPV